MPGVGLDPTLEIAVPKDQRPVNELKQLKQASLYSWVSGDRRSCNATAASWKGCAGCAWARLSTRTP